MLKFGVVVAVDEKSAKARVQIPDLDGITTFWLPVLQKKTKDDKEYWLPDIGEHVAVLFENETDGVVLGAIYSDVDTPPVQNKDLYHVRYSDGAEIEYDRKNHTLKVNIPQGEVYIIVQNGNGNVYINGNLVVSGQIYDLNKAKGSLDDFRNVYNSHTHTGDSGGTTSEPKQKVGA